MLAAGLLQGRPPPGPQMGDTGVSGSLGLLNLSFSGSGACGLFVRMLHTPSSRTKGKLRVTAVLQGHTARTWCPRSDLPASELSASGLLPLPAGPGPQGGAVPGHPLGGGCVHLGGFPPSRVPRRPSGAPASCQGSTRGTSSFLLVWETYLPGPAEDWAWGLSRPRLPSRVSCQWSQLSRDGASGLARPALVPGRPSASDIAKACLLTVPLQAAPRNKLPPDGAPGEEEPRRRGPLPPPLPILKQTLRARLGLSSGPLSYFLSRPRLLGGGTLQFARRPGGHPRGLPPRTMGSARD